jgi:uncharacterized membrane protein YidH (DUF202 family)
MKAFRTVVVAVILAAMFAPASRAFAKSEPRTAPVATETVPVAARSLATTALTAVAAEAARYAQREQQSQDLQNFKGGAVYVYFGSGLVLALVIVILILIL